jgi:hypothetical protein
MTPVHDAQLGMGLGEMTGGAALSPCGRYRYALSRSWDDDLPVALFVMLNPSTADADVDDPTIRRCVSFARSWGCGAITVANLYAYRATDPAELAVADDPVGPDNDYWIATLAADAELIVAAWGATAHPSPTRANSVRDLLRRACAVHCLGRTQHGHPRHPLYVPAATRREEWR